MKSILVAGNWKMNAGPAETGILLEELKERINNRKPGADIVVFPPYVSLQRAVAATAGTPIQVGAQNAWYEENGAYTGEISTSMLLEAGCSWMIAGHSERREFLGETNDVVAKKVKRGLVEGLQVILCVGEKLDQRKKGTHLQVVKDQLKSAIASLDEKNMEQLTVAYEPVWAIGTGETATPEQAGEMHRFIRECVDEFHGSRQSDSLRILYGGSMKPGNAEELLTQAGVDGGLIGGASLQADSFYEIIVIAESLNRG